MTKFKQKEFWIGPAITVATTALGLKQGHDAAEQNEELAEQQRKSEAKTRQVLEKIADSGDAEKQKAAAQVMETKTFAALPTSILSSVGDFAKKNYGTLKKTGAEFLKKHDTANNAVGFAKDLYGTQKGNIKNAAGVAAGIAGTTYLGNRIATSVKDHDEGNDKKNLGFLGKAALTAGTVAGGIWAAKNGHLGGAAKDFMTTGGGAKALNGIKSAVNPIVRHDKDVLDAAGKVTSKAGSVDKMGTALKVGMNGAFLAMPTVSYLAQKKSQDDMTEGTKQFSAMSILSGVGKTVQGAGKSFLSHPGQSISGGINKASSFFGFYGKGGTQAVQNTGKALANGSSEWSKKLGGWITKTDETGKLVNAGKANLLAAAGTLAAGGAVGKVGKDLVEKPTRALDKDAYKMEDEANQKVYSAAMKRLVKTGRRHIANTGAVVHEIATTPGSFVGRKLGETAESVVKAPITGSLLAAAPIPGTEALTPYLGRPEQILYEKTGISKATKGIRGKILGPVKRVLKKAGEGVDQIYNGVQSGSILVPGINM